MALVTGGAVRIGRAIVETLAAQGYGVVIHCRRSQRQAERLAARLRAQGAQAAVVSGALDSEPECERIVEEAWAVGGRLDVLVNNAAVFHKDGLLDSTEEKLLAELRVNALAPIALTRAFALRLRGAARSGRAKSGRRRSRLAGRVINLLDRRVAGLEGGCLPYLLSKNMLLEFTRLAALELAPDIAVNGVAPGAILPPPGKGEAYLRDQAGPVPLARQCSVSDVAEAVVFLVQAESVTGQVVFVDGGQHLLGLVRDH